MKGRLIVLEGGDAVGKATQARMLTEALRRIRRVESMSFPDYASPTGKAVLRHLKGELSVMEDGMFRGEYRKAHEDALVFQSLMAADKYAQAGRMWKLLRDGVDIVCDRYWPSALVYGREDGLDAEWLDSLQEGAPVASVNILLHVPLEEALKRRPEYRDRYEADLGHRERILEGYRTLWAQRAARSPAEWDRWKLVSALPAPDEVHRLILGIVSKVKRSR